MLRMARARADRFGLPFNITLDDIVIPERCPLLDVPIWNEPGRHPYSPTLDRIEPKLGYVKGNVWVISFRANTIKSDASVEEIALLARNLATRLGR